MSVQLGVLSAITNNIAKLSVKIDQLLFFPISGSRDREPPPGSRGGPSLATHPPGTGGSTSSTGSSGILFTHASRHLHVVIKNVSSYRLR